MPKNKMSRKLAAFTLLEVTVVVAVVFAVSIIALPVAINQIQTTRAVSAMKDIRSAMFLVAQNAYTQRNDTSYGIAFFENSYVVYKGNSLANATEQDTFNFTSDIEIEAIDFNGSSELNFAQGSFKPINSGSLNVRNGLEAYTINISSEGLITSEKYVE